MNLLNEHWEDLRRSGLSEETIRKAGFYSVPPDKIGKILGFEPQGLRSAYAIPYDGKFVRIKCFWDEPSGKPKYLSPKGKKNKLYMPFFLTKDFLKGKEPLFVTEGEKKALKACQEQIFCLGLAGWWGWSDGNKELIPDFEEVNLKRKIYLVPDNDLKSANYMKVRNLQGAIKEFAGKLVERGGEVFLIKLPEGKKKLGLDDYLVNHTATDFLNLPKEEIIPNQELRKKALEILNSENPLHEIVDVLSKYCIGRKRELAFFYLATLFPKLRENALLFVTGDTAVGKSYLVSTIFRAIPDYCKIVLSSASGLSLIYRNQDLSERILWISEFQGASQIVEILKGLQTERKIKHATVLDQKFVEFEINAEGFVCVTTTTKSIYDEELLNRGLTLNLEAPEEFRHRVLRFQSDIAEGRCAEDATDYKLLKEVYRLIKPKEVIVPFANEIAKRVEIRETRILRDFPKILNFIRAHCLLNQFKREARDGKIIATLQDYEAIYGLKELLVEGVIPIKKYQLDFLEACLDGITRKDLCIKVGKTDRRIRQLVNELQEYLEIEGKGISQKIRTISIPEVSFPLPPPDEISVCFPFPNFQNANSLEKSNGYIGNEVISDNFQISEIEAWIGKIGNDRKLGYFRPNLLISKEKEKIGNSEMENTDKASGQFRKIENIRGGSNLHTRKITNGEAMPLIAEGLIAPVIQEHRKHSYEEITKFNKTVSLNRKCVICKADKWIILRPNAKVSAIECAECGHKELHALKR